MKKKKTQKIKHKNFVFNLGTLLFKQNIPSLTTS